MKNLWTNKIVNSIIILLLLISCSKKTDNKSQIYTKNSNNYNPDSIYYNIDIGWNENDVEEELFLITKKLVRISNEFFV